MLTQLLEAISGVAVTPAPVVERMAAQGVQIIVPCAGSGEITALSADERDRVARITIEAAGAAPVIADLMRALAPVS